MLFDFICSSTLTTSAIVGRWLGSGSRHFNAMLNRPLTSSTGQQPKLLSSTYSSLFSWTTVFTCHLHDTMKVRYGIACCSTIYSFLWMMFPIYSTRVFNPLPHERCHCNIWVVGEMNGSLGNSLLEHINWKLSICRTNE